MSTRISDSLALVLLLSACGREGAQANTATAAPGSEAIECALAGATSFTHGCAVEPVRSESGLQLVVRHPDGGFRRFDVLTDGHGLATADGAQVATIAMTEVGIEVTVGTDRYRFPATIVNHDRH
jgi:hypothetical protein